MGIGVPELLVIAVIIVVLFGGRRLPELGTGVGKAIANFKKGYREAQEIDITPASNPASDKDPAKAPGSDPSTNKPE